MDFRQKYDRNDVTPHIRKHMWLFCPINEGINFELLIKIIPGEFMSFYLSRAPNTNFQNTSQMSPFV